MVTKSTIATDSKLIDASVWSVDLRELQELAEESLTEWRTTESPVSSDTPPARWLQENGYGHIVWAIDTMDYVTVESFYRFFTSLQATKSNAIQKSQDATPQLIETHLDGMAQTNQWVNVGKSATLSQPHGWTGLTQRARGAQIYVVIQRLIDEHEITDIVVELNETETEEDVRAAVNRVADTLEEELGTALANTYLQTANRFFNYLLQSKIIDYNPVEQETGDPIGEFPAMSVQTVQALWEEAKSPEDQVLVLALCFWEFSLSKLCTLRNEDINIEVGRNDALFTNSDGEVIVLPHGGHPLAALRRESFERKNNEGWLFRGDEENDHASVQQLRQRFQRLVDRADASECTPEDANEFCQNLVHEAEADLRWRAYGNAKAIMESQPSGESVVNSEGRKFSITPERRQGHRYYFFKTQIEEILQP